MKQIKYILLVLAIIIFPKFTYAENIENTNSIISEEQTYKVKFLDSKDNKVLEKEFNNYIINLDQIAMEMGISSSYCNDCKNSVYAGWVEDKKLLNAFNNLNYFDQKLEELGYSRNDLDNLVHFGEFNIKNVEELYVVRFSSTLKFQTDLLQSNGGEQQRVSDFNRNYELPKETTFMAKDGYRFVGWCLLGDESRTLITHVNLTYNDVNVKAVWEKISGNNKLKNNFRFWDYSTNITKVIFENLDDSKGKFDYVDAIDISNAKDESILLKIENDVAKIQFRGKIVLNWNANLMFGNLGNLKSIEGMEYLDTSHVSDMSSMFYNCYSLNSIDLSSFNTSRVEYMSRMFYNCSSLKNIDLSKFDISSIKSLNEMFSFCSSLTELNINSFNITLENKITAKNMFLSCSSLKRIYLDKFDTSNISDFEGMFYGCSSLEVLDLRTFNTKKAEDMSNMFKKCTSLRKLNLSSFVTENVKDLFCMFSDCTSIEIIDLSSFNTKNVTDFLYMFNNCNNLKKIYVSEKWNLNSVYYSIQTSYSIFSQCTQLEGGNGTKFSSISKNEYDFYKYLRIDIPGQSGLLTLKLDENQIFGSNETYVDTSKFNTRSYSIQDNVLYGYSTNNNIVFKIDLVQVDFNNCKKDNDTLLLFATNIKELDAKLSDNYYIKYVSDDEIEILNSNNENVIATYKVKILFDKVSFSNNEVTFDKNEHGILVDQTNNPTNTYHINIYYMDLNGNYSLEYMPMYTETGKYEIKYKLSISGYDFNYFGSKKVIINKANIEEDNSIGYEGIYDNNEHTIKIDIPNIEGYTIKYSIDGKDYNLTEIPKYKESGNYEVLYKVSSKNYNDYYSSKKVIINKANIEEDNSIGYEGIYDNNEHTIKIDIPNIEGYTIKYSIDGKDYNLTEIPKFEKIGNYSVYYKIYSNNYNEYSNYKIVNIYGIISNNNIISNKNSNIIISNIIDKFSDIVNNFSLYVKKVIFNHLNSAKELIEDVILKTGDIVEIIIDDIKYEYQVSVKADVNGDGEITPLDYVAIKNHIMEKNIIEGNCYLEAADVNSDDEITPLDYVAIKNYIMKGENENEENQ